MAHKAVVAVPVDPVAEMVADVLAAVVAEASLFLLGKLLIG